MPVTVNVVNHAAKPWSSGKVASGKKLLEGTSPKQFRRTERVVQSSFTDALLKDAHTSPSENGFVWAAIHAYSSHHHLTIRPEDVWFAILTQLSFHINANAEKLRSFFVEHEGQKHLEVIANGTIDTLDFGALAERMTQLIAKNVKDPELRDWVMPAFTTTTDSDIATAAVLFMGAMQKYFTYEFSTICGIPSVTVLGEISDWEAILTKLDKLEQLGEEPTRFAELLRPILRNIILSFTEPTSPAVINFWNTIADKRSMSGRTDYDGWIAAFCYWSEEGKAQNYMRSSHLSISSKDIPTGFCSVPVLVNDHGTIYNCTMIAGSVGIQARAAETLDPADAGLTAIQPLSGWWICENEPAKATEERAAEMKRIQEELAPLNEIYKKEMEEYMAKWKEYMAKTDHKTSIQHYLKNPFPQPTPKLQQLQSRLTQLKAF